MAMRKTDVGMRKRGFCPHDGKKCGRAARCTWSKEDSCEVNNMALVEKCSPVNCRRKFGACKWKCVRRGRSSKVREF
jgi:hypothetical protein